MTGRLTSLNEAFVCMTVYDCDNVSCHQCPFLGQPSGTACKKVVFESSDRPMRWHCLCQPVSWQLPGWC